MENQKHNIRLLVNQVIHEADKLSRVGSYAASVSIHKDIANAIDKIVAQVEDAPVLPDERIAKCFTLLAASMKRGEFRDVLAAWRGPDQTPEIGYRELDAIKNRTTAVIRRKVLDTVDLLDLAIRSGGTEGYYYYDGLMVARKSGLTVRLTEAEHYNNSHFFVHVKAAARSLGIRIDIVKNDEVGSVY